MNIHVLSRNTVLDNASEKLNEVILASLREKKPVLFLLSGGSSLKLLDKVDTNALSPHFTITVLDERYSKDPSENNFAQVSNTAFYTKAKDMGCKFIDTRVLDKETQEKLSNRYNDALSDWVDKNKDGIVVATIGIGHDGHISGIMPYPEDEKTFDSLFNNTNRYAVAYDASGKNPYPLRITTTMPLLRLINHAVVYATGQEKKDALKRVLASNGRFNETPSRVLKELKTVDLFTDITL